MSAEEPRSSARRAVEQGKTGRVLLTPAVLFSLLYARQAPPALAADSDGVGRRACPRFASPCRAWPASTPATKVSSRAPFGHSGRLVCLWLTLSGRLGPIYACICPRAAAALMNCSSTLASPEGGQGTALHRPSGYGTEVKFVCFRFARAPPGAAASRLRFGRPSSSSPAGRPCFFACLFWRASAHADRWRPCTLFVACVCPRCVCRLPCTSTHA